MPETGGQGGGLKYLAACSGEPFGLGDAGGRVPADLRFWRGKPAEGAFAAGVNLLVGVQQAGYTVAEELPIFGAVLVARRDYLADRTLARVKTGL